MSITQAKKVVKQYGNYLRKHNFSFSELYLFGSYARGKQHADSDIDVAVVVAKAAEDSRKYLQQRMKLWKLASKVNLNIEPVLLEEEDLEKNSISIMGEQVKKEGILIK